MTEDCKPDAADVSQNRALSDNDTSKSRDFTSIIRPWNRTPVGIIILLARGLGTVWRLARLANNEEFLF